MSDLGVHCLPRSQKWSSHLSKIWQYRISIWALVISQDEKWDARYERVNLEAEMKPVKSYHNVPKFSDRYAWANNADPDQTAPLGGSTLFAIPSASFGCITLRKHHLVQVLGWLQYIFGFPKFLRFYGSFPKGNYIYSYMPCDTCRKRAMTMNRKRMSSDFLT